MTVAAHGCSDKKTEKTGRKRGEREKHIDEIERETREKERERDGGWEQRRRSRRQQ
ncbi:hypothetical protein HanIR_Chr15g0739001 [Helianthus annuus]|nr:hypothetical protein HanIR_Chr15g0739001 [Helianthus annuus]